MHNETYHFTPAPKPASDPTPMLLDDFVTQAERLLKAAGYDRAELTASQRHAYGRPAYYLCGSAATDAEPWGRTIAVVQELTAGDALTAFAHALGQQWPLPATEYATAEQVEKLISLYNHPQVSRAEKTQMLLHKNTYTYAQAEQMLADGPTSFRQELRRREAASRGLAVTGTAELVTPPAALPAQAA